MDPHIIRSIAEGQALFFLGAGFSAAYGQKTTASLCASIRAAVELEASRHPCEERTITDRLSQIAPSDLARLSQLYDHYYGTDSAKQLVVSLLKKHTVDIASIGTIAELPISTLVTTNFDDLIEKAFDDKLDVCFSDDHIGPQVTRRTRLIKMHGSVADYKSLVLERDDYDRFAIQRPKTCRVLQGQLVEKLPIVVGYSMEDSNFRMLIKELREKDWKTQILVIQRTIDSVLESEWHHVNVRFLKADAKEFLEGLNEELRQYRRSARSIGSFSRLNVESFSPDTDHNPFKFFQTDKISYSDRDVIRKYFIEVPEYAKIVSTSSNTIIAGSRGSGKTMLLRYLSIEVQLSANEKSTHLPFAGFYVNGGVKLFNSMSCRGDGTCANRKWVDFFTHVLNLAIVLRVCQVLELLKSLRALTFESEREKLFCTQLVNSLIRCQWRPGFAEPTFKNSSKAIEDAFNTARASSLEAVPYTLSLDFLHQLAELLCELHEVFSGRPIFILLDEMEYLTSAQLQVLNTFLKDRADPITFKVAAAAEGWPTQDSNGNILKYGDDYTLVSTDKYSKDRSEDYLAFLRHLADKCLAESNCEISSIEELLEQREHRTPSERLNFIGREFSGFKRYAYLSSGVVRTFVMLLKDTVAYAIPEIQRRATPLKTISFQQQNTVVQVASAIHRQHYLDTTNPDDVLAIVNALAQVFRRELTKSVEACRQEVNDRGDFDYDHLRSISQVQIQNFSKLNPRVKNALALSLGVGLLQRPMDNRQPQQRTQVPHENFKIHRMLCPYYELGLANRFPRKIEAGLLNLVFDLTETEFARRAGDSRSKRSKDDANTGAQPLLDLSLSGGVIDVLQEYDCDAE